MAYQRPKIALIGAGQIGGIMALLAAQKELGDIVVLDIPAAEGTAKGKALDIQHLRAIGGFDAEIQGTSSYDDIAGAAVVIVTAGVPRKPGMSRDDLVNVNLGIVRNVAENLKQKAPDAFVIVITNPLDQMVYAMQKLTGFPAHQVCGMAGVLDSARLRYFLADALNQSVTTVQAMVLGGHGDTMVPVISAATVGGVPVTALLPKETIDAIVKRTAGAGGEIVKLLGNGSAFFSPAAAAIQMAEAYLKDKKALLPAAAMLNGEFGLSGFYFGVPTIIGAGGIEKIVECPMNADERAMLDKSASAVQGLLAEMTI
jgi:malate dehydrogenase